MTINVETIESLPAMKIIEKLLKEKTIQSEDLTREQLADLIRQMIKSGDIKNLVHPGSGAKICYIPYMLNMKHLLELVENLNKHIETMESSCKEKLSCPAASDARGMRNLVIARILTLDDFNSWESGVKPITRLEQLKNFYNKVIQEIDPSKLP